MCRCLSILCFLALTTQGCGQQPKVFPLSSWRFDYRTWNCRELAEESSLLRDALAVASEQGAFDTVAHLKTATEEVHKASTLKKCSA